MDFDSLLPPFLYYGLHGFLNCLFFKHQALKQKEFLNSSLKEHRGWLSSCLVTDEAARPGLIDLRVVLPDLDDPSGLNDHCWPPVLIKIFRPDWPRKFRRDISISPSCQRGKRTGNKTVKPLERKIWPQISCLLLMRPLLNYAAALSASWQYCGKGWNGEKHVVLSWRMRDANTKLLKGQSCVIFVTLNAL
jgi:hypothetical protein